LIDQVEHINNRYI